VPVRRLSLRQGAVNMDRQHQGTLRHGDAGQLTGEVGVQRSGSGRSGGGLIAATLALAGSTR
jgi:hypothetical protein